MKKLILILTLGGWAVAESPSFVDYAKQIPASELKTIPVVHNGRIKPFDTFARESAIFLTGKRTPLGLHPTQFYLAMITHPQSLEVECVEIRNKGVRVALGFPKSKRSYSLKELEGSVLTQLAKPLAEKEQQNARSLSPYEKDVLEAFHQYSLGRDIQTGEQFLSIVELSPPTERGHAQSGVRDRAIQLLRTVAKQPEAATASARELASASVEQPVPELFAGYKDRLGLEVSYNQWRPFLVAGVLYFCLALALILGFLKNAKLPYILLGYSVPLFFHVGGFFTRIYITGFAPVTNMYTTMLWMAFGVVLFSSVLLALYRNQILVGLLLFGASLVLLLTESFPLILSPDMDPIVAVLRSNFWLTLHVLTITISYAAFTICMLVGNYAMLHTLWGGTSDAFYRTYAHYAYRMAQLGVCLITAGIILGGIWADYSWGRFWGWDPKETWALIADMGFIVILHAKYIGWLGPFGILAASPVAYLLVVMAWYGVNFILAAGLHSYGFSSGGATAVAVFVSIQLILVGAAIIAKKRRLSLR